jgi:uncharacterized membrane protein (DUF2068 family)
VKSDPSPSPASRHAPPRDTVLFLIAAFKLVKGTMLLCVAAGALSLVHRDVAAVLEHVIEALRADPHNRYLHGALAKAGLLSDRKLEEIGLGTFVYAAVFFTEGIGLLLRKHWAEYFTLGVTTSFVPLELYELTVHASMTKVAVVLINFAVIGYLVWRLRRERQLRREARDEAREEEHEVVPPRAKDSPTASSPPPA